MTVTLLVENTPAPGWEAEHGLSLLLEDETGLLLFDTGAGGAFASNSRRFGLDPAALRRIVLSHGHADHTGALAQILPLAPQADLWFGAGIDRVRFSHHPGRPVKELTMPEAARRALYSHPAERRHPLAAFTEIAPGLHLTGPIPRTSFEDCGGPFFLDREGRIPDRMTDEIALLTAGGVLVQGCCHAGILNTLDLCARHRPEIPVRTLIGGLHLLHASVSRLERTADALGRLPLERLILLHCTGDSAVAFLKSRLACEVTVARTGDTFTL